MDKKIFFDTIRPVFGTLNAKTGKKELSGSQVLGFETLIEAFRRDAWPLSWVAYGLATAWHETRYTMQPVAEAYWVKSPEAWRKKNLRYYPWYGRGYPQLTWEANYRKADAALKMNGALIANPDLALQPDIAVRIMVWGMTTGAYTGRALKHHLPASKPAILAQFKDARKIINGVDDALLIAGYAASFQTALLEAGY